MRRYKNTPAEHVTVPQVCIHTLLPFSNGPAPRLAASPAQFVLVISHSQQECNTVQRDCNVIRNLAKNVKISAAVSVQRVFLLCFCSSLPVMRSAACGHVRFLITAGRNHGHGVKWYCHNMQLDRRKELDVMSEGRKSDGSIDVICPFCGAEATHRLSQVDATKWRYICSRCHKVFIVDETTGEIVR